MLPREVSTPTSDMLSAQKGGVCSMFADVWCIIHSQQHRWFSNKSITTLKALSVSKCRGVQQLTITGCCCVSCLQGLIQRIIITALIKVDCIDDIILYTEVPMMGRWWPWWHQVLAIYSFVFGLAPLHMNLVVAFLLRLLYFICSLFGFWLIFRVQSY